MITGLPLTGGLFFEEEISPKWSLRVRLEEPTRQTKPLVPESCAKALYWRMLARDPGDKAALELLGSDFEGANQTPLEVQ